MRRIAFLVLLATALPFTGCRDEPSTTLPPRLPQSAPAIRRPEPVPSRSLVREGAGFAHQSAQVRVTLPTGWRAIEEPIDQSAISALKLARGADLRATLTFAPLERGLEQVAFEQVRTLRRVPAGRDGRSETVSNPVRVEPAGRPGWRIDITPAGGGERGVIWLFEARPATGDPWRVRLRVTLPEGTDGDEILPLIEGIELPQSASIREATERLPHAQRGDFPPEADATATLR